jgi:hypothetical protein
LVYEHDPVDAVSMIHRDGDDFSPQSMPSSIHGGAS